MIHFFTNHDPHFSNNDLEIVEGYCGEWKSPCADFEPIDKLGRRNKLGQAWLHGVWAVRKRKFN